VPRQARIAGDALVFSLVLGGVVAAGLIHELPRMFALMRTPSDVTALGTTYLHTLLFGTPLIYGFFAIDAGVPRVGRHANARSFCCSRQSPSHSFSIRC
jgi:Na+-driven multidrug efflux pump